MQSHAKTLLLIYRVKSLKNMLYYFFKNIFTSSSSVFPSNYSCYGNISALNIKQKYMSYIILFMCTWMFFFSDVFTIIKQQFFFYPIKLICFPTLFNSHTIYILHLQSCINAQMNVCDILVYSCITYILYSLVCLQGIKSFQKNFIFILSSVENYNISIVFKNENYVYALLA